MAGEDSVDSAAVAGLAAAAPVGGSEMATSRVRDLEARVERFAAALERAAGDNLASLVLYGSAAAGAAREDSDVNLLLVLRDAGAASLRPLGNAVREWVREGERPPLIFSERSWRAAADVFPLEIEDIRARHRVLRGRDPVADIATAPDDGRRELEREARGRLVQLRAAYAAAESDGKALSDLTAQACKALVPLFRATLRLAGRTPADTAGAVVGEVAALAGLEAAAFDWPLARLAGTAAPDLAPYDARAARFLDAASAFVDYVDRVSPRETT